MPIHDPCALLNRLLEEPTESTWLEFKVDNKDPREIGEYVSALANSAMLAGRDRAFLVFGVEDRTKRRVGTELRLQQQKQGNEDFTNWLARMVEPRVFIEVLDFVCDGLAYSVVAIEPSYERPVKFAGTEFVRIGENKKKLAEFAEHERALWIATGRRRFETAVASSNVTADDVLVMLDPDPIYDLTAEPKPKNPQEIIRKMVDAGFLLDNLEGRFDITNLGAIMLARDVTAFPSIAGKTVRIVKYSGRDKSRSDFEQEGKKGYAVGFTGMMRFLMERLPKEEKYIDGVRRMVPHFPETAVREVIANALIHQDFMATGVGPVVEIYENRIEVTNPGNSLISTDRILDERRSRNEKLAATMRSFGLCEERGGGLDKTLIEIEAQHLPAPDFISSENSMRVVLFAPKPFGQMSKAEKLRACFFHCVLRWLTHDYMSNATLRERFSLAPEEYQAVSAVIGESIKLGRIAPADPDQGKRNARYVPYWAA
ncbi:putative HTH transcriptional regulator [Sinorhizobium terangae]|uniref:Transcriptional regulator n=1 Tax=Sinorhizobium terangae TaxID=110322 RepID=A0A6N7LMT7_SINTE|nr:ATP-binding protein [Sinorhizobium terangae]MBB4189314.1 putative HTH transcriptional regulator [Sinorhizobium terangae]MQX18175.1 transcriptional regulator [Sinorhizobium terangae]